MQFECSFYAVRQQALGTLWDYYCIIERIKKKGCCRQMVKPPDGPPPGDAGSIPVSDIGEQYKWEATPLHLNAYSARQTPA